MNILFEKINERINHRKALVRYEKNNGTITGVARNEGALEELEIFEKIIRSHMNEAPADWIPVSERLPNEEDFIKSYCRNKYRAEFIVMIKGATRPTTLYFKNGVWADDNNNHYKVIAWKPLPEPYKEESENDEM